MALNPDLVAELRKRFRGDIRQDLASKLLYSTDASIYQIEPAGVLIPRTREDLQIAVELAAAHRVPVVARGAGTSLAGQAIGEGLILDCSRWLDRILEIDPERRTATVEPGVILADLNRAAAAYGLQFGPDPASAERATMGGVVANNATGAHSILYGMTADHLLTANVVLSDGSLAEFGTVRAEHGTSPAPSDLSRHSQLTAAARRIRTQNAQAIEQKFPRTWRNSAGYRINYLVPWSAGKPAGWSDAAYPPRSEGAEFNLAQLLAGSEGTLGVIQDVTVGLVPRPRHAVLGILAFEDLPAACEAVPELLEHGPAAVELIPRLILEAARRIPAYASRMHWLRGDPAALLVVEFSGDDPEQLVQRARSLGLRGADRGDPGRTSHGLGHAQGGPRPTGHGGWSGTAHILHRGLRGARGASRRIRPRARTHHGCVRRARRHLRARFGWLPARPPCSGSKDRRRCARSAPDRGANSGADPAARRGHVI